LRVSFLNIFFTGVLALSLFLGTSARRNWILLPSLRFFADISYGLYLVHMIVFDVVDHFMKGPVLRVAGSAGDFIAVWFRFFVGAGLSVAVAYLSRWYFEERFLRMKDSGGVIR
jgi:peptidoglycan/LPS O-acetylase OafA/YrhL